MKKVRMTVMLGLLIGVAAALAPVAGATTVVLPGDGTWGSTGNSGGGSSEITFGLADVHGGLGSLELRGDRTRFINADPWSSDPADSLGLLSNVTAITFEWAIASDSISNRHADYTPALRLHVYDPNATANRTANLELIWEGAYNGVYGSGVTADTWYTTSTDDAFWRWEGNVTLDGGAQVNQSIANWATGVDSGSTRWFSDSAMVMAVSIGVGSSAGSDYHAYADYVTLNFDGGTSTTWDFEPVPEPTTMIMLGALGTGMIAARRRRKRS